MHKTGRTTDSCIVKHDRFERICIRRRKNGFTRKWKNNEPLELENKKLLSTGNEIKEEHVGETQEYSYLFFFFREFEMNRACASVSKICRNKVETFMPSVVSQFICIIYVNESKMSRFILETCRMQRRHIMCMTKRFYEKKISLPPPGRKFEAT